MSEETLCEIVNLNPFIRRLDQAIWAIMGYEITKHLLQISINRERFVQRCAIKCFIDKRKDDKHVQIIREAATNLELFNCLQPPIDPQPGDYA